MIVTIDKFIDLYDGRSRHISLYGGRSRQASLYAGRYIQVSLILVAIDRLVCKIQVCYSFIKYV